MSSIKDNISKYYGEVLESSSDLKTGACCSTSAMPCYASSALKNVHKDVCEKFYGCGAPIPPCSEGIRVLDLGCGTGRDCYIVSQLIGEKGFVIGVDMTENQLAVANSHIEWHMNKFGYNKPNVEFRFGHIEDLKSANIADESIDLVISNCVFNLSPEKEKVFSEIFRVLTPGGQLYFSDIFASKRIPKELLDDPVLRGECLSGAMVESDFSSLLEKYNCLDYKIENTSEVPIQDPDIKSKLDSIEFYSHTIQAFKVK